LRIKLARYWREAVALGLLESEIRERDMAVFIRRAALPQKTRPSALYRALYLS
jgi:hypothetical protein